MQNVFFAPSFCVHYQVFGVVWGDSIRDVRSGRETFRSRLSQDSVYLKRG